MSEIEKVFEIPAKRETRIVGHICDFCEKRIEKIQYKVNEATIEMRIGTNYPEGGNSTTTEVDICTDCFKTKLIPWLRSLKIDLRVKENDW